MPVNYTCLLFIMVTSFSVFRIIFVKKKNSLKNAFVFKEFSGFLAFFYFNFLCWLICLFNFLNKNINLVKTQEKLNIKIECCRYFYFLFIHLYIFLCIKNTFFSLVCRRKKKKKGYVFFPLFLVHKLLHTCLLSLSVTSDEQQ